MKSIVKRFVQEEEAASTTEYALILGLVGIAAAVGMGLLGTELNNWYTALSETVAGLATAP